MNFPVSLDDLKQWYYGVTNPNTWRRGLDQLQVAKNAISSAGQRIGPTGGTPISDPTMNLNDLWKKVSNSLNIGDNSRAQNQNMSGIR